MQIEFPIVELIMPVEGVLFTGLLHYRYGFCTQFLYPGMDKNDYQEGLSCQGIIRAVHTTAVLRTIRVPICTTVRSLTIAPHTLVQASVLREWWALPVRQGAAVLERLSPYCWL